MFYLIIVDFGLYVIQLGNIQLFKKFNCEYKHGRKYIKSKYKSTIK